MISAMVQIGIHHIPALEALFQIRDLPPADCIVTLLLGLVPVTVLELTKLVRRARQGGGDRTPRASEVPV